MVFHSWRKILSFLVGILISTTFAFALPDEIGTVIGIDLGTTHSCVGVYYNSHVDIIANDLGNRTTPSFVAFTDTEVLIGDSAKDQAHLNPERTIFDVKRLLGRKFDDPEVQRCIKMSPYKIVNKDGKPYIQVVVKDGEAKVFSPEEISAMMLQKMKEIAESYLGKTVKDAVISVPSYFSDAQREATREAGRISGLNVARIIDEPIAAALGYGLEKETREFNVLVFDLGGGTFDVTLLGIDNGAFKMLATNGETRLGGEDFYHRLINYFVELIKKRHNKDISNDKEALGKLRKECERAKRALNFPIPVRVEIESLFYGIDFSETLRRAWFEELNMDLFEKTMSPLKKALEDAKLKKSDIDEIVLVGGSTKIPKVRQLVQDFFDGKEPHRGINAEEAVAFGATVYGAKLSGDFVEHEDDFAQYGFHPRRHGVALSLSIETAGVMTKMIPQYTFFPTKKSQIITTSEDQQTKVEIKVYEGENKNCRELGKFELSGISPAPRGVPQIEVTFEVDSDDVFLVTAEDKASKNKNSLSLTNCWRRRRLLNANDIEQLMLDYEEHFFDGENTMIETMDSRNKLRTYIYSMQSTIRDKSKLADNIDSEIKEKIEGALKVVLEWFDNNYPVAGKDDFDEKTRELEDLCEPVIKKAYEATHLKDEELKDEL